jgi:PAS domain S-box-containing protein
MGVNSKKTRVFTSKKVRTIILTVIIVCGLSYFFINFNRVAKTQEENALLYARAVTTFIKTADILKLAGDTTDLDRREYIEIKNALKSLIEVNTPIRFAYLYAKQGDSIIFLADSEPERSEDYSPPGQVFSEVSEEDLIPIIEGREVLTTSLTDRWGTWRSILIPIKDSKTNEVIAVFGIDIESSNWTMILIYEATKSSLLIILLILSLILIFRLQAKKKDLEKEVELRKKIYKSLEESEILFKTLFMKVPVSIIVFDKESGEILDANPEAINAFGYDSFEAFKEHEGWIEPPYSFNDALSLIRNTPKEGTNSFEWISKKKNYELRWEEVRLNVATIRGIDRVMSSSIDITERKKAEIALQENNRQLENSNIELKKAIEKAEESERLKTAFLNNISHEIRTPMNAILGFSEIINKQNTDFKKDSDYIDIICKSSQRLLSTINKIVEISKIESKDCHIQYSVVNLLDLIQKIKTKYELKAKNKKLEFEVKCIYERENSSIITDKNKLENILENLIDNSLLFTEIGKVSIEVSLNNEFAEFKIEDTGSGIPEDVQKTLFEPFMHKEVYRGDKYHGIGLGLAITKSFIDQLKGKIWYKSIEGKGTTFYFRIPRTETSKGECLFDKEKA